MGRQVVWAIAAVVVIASLHLQCVTSQKPPSLPPPTTPTNAAIPPSPSLPSTPPINTPIHPPPSLPSTPPVNTLIPPPPSLPSTPPLNTAAPPLTATPPLNAATPPLPATPPLKAAAHPLPATPPISLSVPPLPSVPSISPVVAPPLPTTRSSQSPETFTVGGTLGWTVPPGGATTYTAWVSGKTFLVGDTLFFNFTTGEHDVAKVTKTGFDSCSNSSSNIIGFLITTGPANVVLDAEGEHYYICTFTKHCQLGQKLVLNVTGTASPPSASPPSSPSPPSAAPSSSTVSISRFSVTLLTATIFSFFL